MQDKKQRNQLVRSDNTVQSFHHIIINIEIKRALNKLQLTI